MNTSTNQPLQFLLQFSLFESCTKDELERLASGISVKQYQRYELIFEEGEPADKVYFLVKGNVKRASYSDQGREVIKEILHPISMFGELSLVNHSLRKDFTQVISDEAKIMIITRKDLIRLMKVNPNWSLHLMHWFAQRLRQTESKLESMISKDARDRIIEFLKETANRQGRKVGLETLIKHSLTQQDIANMTGTSRQTVTSVLNELRRSNHIYFNRRSILIRDVEKLG